MLKNIKKKLIWTQTNTNTASPFDYVVYDVCLHGKGRQTVDLFTLFVLFLGYRLCDIHTHKNFVLVFS